MIFQRWKRKNLLVAWVTGLCIIVLLKGQTKTLTGILADNYTQLMGKMEGRVYISENYTGFPCNYTLDIPLEKRLEKISSYEFSGIQNYLIDLFPSTMDRVMPENPVFVSAISSNHCDEGIALIANFNRMVNVNGTMKLILYDIGLTGKQNEKVQQKCQCEVRNFPFENFPTYVRKLRSFLWKPLAIQLVAREHPFVIWMDASIRFTTSKREGLVELAKKRGVLAAVGHCLVAFQTSIETFRFLNEIPCLFGRRTPEIAANFVIIYQTSFIKKYFMIPWVSCALIRGCMMTHEKVEKIVRCAGKRHYFHCHRFDQSILSILMYRLFHGSIADYLVDKSTYYSVCRKCKKIE